MLACIQKSSPQTGVRRRSMGSVDVRPPIIKNTIRLDDLQETKSSSSTSKPSKDHVRVQRFPLNRWQMVSDSRISQIETIDLALKTSSATQADTTSSPSTVRVDRMVLSKNNKKSAISATSLTPIIKSVKRSNNWRVRPIGPNITVEFVPKE